MFVRIISARVLSISHRIVKSSILTSRDFCRHVTVKSYPIAPNAPGLLCRLYSKEANLEGMVVDFEDVQKATSSGNVLIIDVREPDEVKEYGKIPNSINIPLGTLPTALNTMPDAEFERIYKRTKPTEETEIIFYCMIGKRSGMAQQNAFNLGYKNVKNYLGSWTDWSNKIQQ